MIHASNSLVIMNHDSSNMRTAIGISEKYALTKDNGSLASYSMYVSSNGMRLGLKDDAEEAICGSQSDIRLGFANLDAGIYCQHALAVSARAFFRRQPNSTKVVNSDGTMSCYLYVQFQHLLVLVGMLFDSIKNKFGLQKAEEAGRDGSMTCMLLCI